MEALAIITPAVASVLTLVVSLWHSRRTASESREFDASERRIEARTDAAIGFDHAAEAVVNIAADLAVDPKRVAIAGPLNQDIYPLRELLAAHARIEMLCTQEVIAAAREVLAGTQKVTEGKQGTTREYLEALGAYRGACRTMLSERRPG